MSLAPVNRTTEIMADVLSLVKLRVKGVQREVIEEFVGQYYAGVAAEELASQAPENLYGAALAHWNFAKQRKPGEPKIRAYNPQLEQYGWQSTHSIVEVVTDDMPFLVDSVRMALNARGLTNHLLIHPVMRFTRDAKHHIATVLNTEQELGDGIIEAVMHIEVDRQADENVLATIGAEVRGVLADVRCAVEDWPAIRTQLAAIITDLSKQPPPLQGEEIKEGREFLEWMQADHFTFLAYRDYNLVETDGEVALRPLAGSGLGLLREDRVGVESHSFARLPASIRNLAREKELMVITKANSRSTVHRPGYMDYVGVKRFDKSGVVIGERRFLGLYTSAAYNRSPSQIPLLRSKVVHVVARAGYPENSHAAKALWNIVDTFPRDLLFPIPESELFQTALGILHLQERQRIRLFVHRDRYARFFSCIVYVPRERFNTQVRQTIAAILADNLNGGDTEFTVQLSDSVLARLYFTLRISPGNVPDYDVSEIEQQLTDAVRSWSDDLSDALLDHCGEERSTVLFRRYGEAFRADYYETYSARLAVFDIEKMELLGDGAQTLAMSLYRPLEAANEILRFKLFNLNRPIPLSDALPMLENMGLKVEDEHPSRIERADGSLVWMHDFGLTHREVDELDIGAVKEKFQQAFARIWFGEVENDGFNRLVLRARLTWREIVVLRAYCKYLRQAGSTFSQVYMENTLASNPEIACALVALFHCHFDPDNDGNDREAGAAQIESRILSALDAVANLDEDRILLSFLGVIKATLRTNYYQTDVAGKNKTYVSFKFDPAKIVELPEPRPKFEIFVYSPRVEGVHLRGGPVARGGLRWSDRREDFRTEVLGLVKAQMVKNAVIVPVGSKGGFVPKRLPAPSDREAFQAEGIECYKTFIRGLLDITDNLSKGDIVPPKDVLRRDGDDPYLVVAADKGTATFSDIANGIAEEYGFWLGDAFASGGSQGYDHKGMGITARGAWESVKRHFRELGMDIQKEEFSVVGIGDMAGDVFGNGLLLSRHIRLIGAFNHMHIFLDPDPQAERSFAERQRLFALPRSTWEDYDSSLISAGGGIFPRSAKSIPLSPKVRKRLGVNEETMPPNDLIRALLTAQVDLLWNGGIGTYIKATAEHDADVGDRANDAVRIDATQLRSRVVGEGGNLGITQLGRIEIAQHGGRVNTDAIDNAGGVDCSDHEVNIKILLHDVVIQGDMTVKQRNALLVSMTDEVSALVLRNNYLQTQTLSLACSQAPLLLDVHERLIRHLERDGALDRAIEFLPDKEQVQERMSAGRGLSSPELSVLMAYVKITLFQELLASNLSLDPTLFRELTEYFPTHLREKFAPLMGNHRLSREIVATVVANGLVNRAGMTFVFRMQEETGADTAEVARAYMIATEVFEMSSFWADVEALDNQVPASVQIAMQLEGRKMVERAARWFLRSRPRPLDIAANVAYFRTGVSALATVLPDLVAKSSQKVFVKMVDGLTKQGVPEALAKRAGGFNELFSALDIVEVGNAVKMDLSEVASVYFLLSEKLELHWLRDQIVKLPRGNRWQALARAAMRDDLYSQESTLTEDVLKSGGYDGPAARIDAWISRNVIAANRCRQILTDLKGVGQTDFTMLSVVMREIRSLRSLSASNVELAGSGNGRKVAKPKKVKGKA